MRGIVIGIYVGGGSPTLGRIRTKKGEVYTFTDEDLNPHTRTPQIGDKADFLLKSNKPRLGFGCSEDFEAKDVVIINR